MELKTKPLIKIPLMEKQAKCSNLIAYYCVLLAKAKGTFLPFGFGDTFSLGT